jgi:tRNA modification GTPase
VVEIQAHSGLATMRTILELVLDRGARIADPGEFTKRAYLNGRIDLTRAEAVIDIINARTGTALRSAAGQINGKLNAVIEDIKSVLTDLLVDIEAGIDFPEDVAEILPTEDVAKRIRHSVNEPIKSLIERYCHYHVYRDGLRLVIIGKPNVGKSSLMNCLVRKERAIVTDLPGTTRDLVEEGLQIRGIPVNIVDTAGLHDSQDPVERIGIHKARECIQGADLVLFLVDAAGELSADDHQIYNQYSGMNIILVLNKMDLVDNNVSSQLKTPEKWNGIPRVAISALYETGIDELEELIVKSAVGDYGRVSASSMIPNLRHKQALEKCLDSVDRALAGINTGQPVELTAIDVKAAIEHLDDIVGTTPSPDILDQIFSSFCIGK